MTTSTSISVVIATHQRPVLVERCLQALIAQVLPPTEVIVIDDASRDDTPAVLREWVRRPSINFRTEALEVNGGPARARNRGISLARGEWVAFTDDDCAPEPDWLAAMAARASEVSSRVAGIGGRVLPSAPGLVADYMTVHRILEPPPSCSYLVTSNCIYRRQVLLEVGGFNEKVRTPGGEDPGLSFAVRQAGYSLGFCPEAVVRHHYRESICRSPGTWGQRLTFSPGSWGHLFARVMGPGSRVIGPWIARDMGPVDRQGHGATPMT